MTNNKLPTRLIVVLVKPTKYDTDGYLVQFVKGVLPCNTLAAMYSLTKAAFVSSELAGLDCRVIDFDETSMWGALNPQKVMEEYSSPNTKVVVGLVGVQTNMFSRAQEIAFEFKRLGAEVVIGGFHVSGSITMLHDGSEDNKIPCPHIMPPECAELMEKGVIIFHGESEASWHQVLGDIVRGEQKLLYRGGRPPLDIAPLPEYPNGYFKSFFARMHTFDTGRGCPYSCSFCTIINVQGHDSRYRSVDAIVGRIRKACQEERVPFFFFTDDNFARGKYWREILIGLTHLREEEGLDFKFMIEADLAAWKMPDFVDLLSKAGCTHVFMGVESVRQETLNRTRKRQNHVSEFSKMTDLYHSYGIVCHAGYILGFPADTTQTIAEDIETLATLGFDQASFFTLTPLPGSEDHTRMFMAGIAMDQDFNKYDSFEEPVMAHPIMSREEWTQAYKHSWKRFYVASHMIASLSRVAPNEYWSLFRNFLWYRWSAIVEGVHPMMAGFFRHKHYASRRKSALQMSYSQHVFRQIWRCTRYFGLGVREYLLFQQVYFGSRWVLHRASAEKDGLEKHLREWRMRVEQSRWFEKTFGQAAHREWLNAFWQRYAQLKWRLILPHKWGWHIKSVPYLTAEVVYFVRFNVAIFRTLLRQNPLR
jgi:radical SAM superfamily enzyme YgiQ (UPF0313 family)